ncbi:MAG: type IV secretory system conjugative DNA transfer family protein [Actinomycetes bacterium]
MRERRQPDSAAPAARLALLPADHPDRAKPKPLGDSDAGPRRGIGLAIADARHHLHVIGATGTGKSTLLTNLILADATAGRGVAVLDPKGDLITDLLARLPADVGDRLVLIDPVETQAPPAWNVLDSHGRDPDLVVDQIVGVFARLYAAYWGPRTDDVFRSACLTLIADPDVPVTLADIPRLLSDPAYRAGRIRGLTDPAGLGGFWTWYDALSDAGRAQVVGPVMNKLRAVLSRRFAADLFGSAASTFTLSDILDGGILLARLPKGLLGEDTTRLVGSLLLSGLWQAATARATIAEPNRLDATIYVDECHNFLHLPGSLDDVLAEARGYHLSLTLAHQHLGQLPRDIADAAHANARNKAFFTLSPDDARVLARHVGPYLTAEDLGRLDRYQLACRLVSHGRDTHGFTLATRPAGPASADRTGVLRQAARARGRGQGERRGASMSRALATPDETNTGLGPIRAPRDGHARPKTTPKAESDSLPVPPPSSPPVPLPALETGADTGRPTAANPHVSRPAGPQAKDSDSRW